MANPTNDAGGFKSTGAPQLDTTHGLPAAGQSQDGFQQAKDQAKELAQGAREQVKSLASDAKDGAKDVAQQARDHVQGLIGQQKDQAADRLGVLASALRDAGRKLNQDQAAGDVGQYADRAAGQVERLSKYLRQSDLSHLIRDTESFARRRPEVFLGGTIIAGLMLARFLKASAPKRATQRGPKDSAAAKVGYQPLRTGSQAGASYASPPRLQPAAGAYASPVNPPAGA